MNVLININNKNWDKLRSSDIEKLLTGIDDENFFFEFKADDETPPKLIKEISAFANTYGGYILLGVNDNKIIGGCTKWTEQRIHTVIHDSITPTPNFDVKKFKVNGNVILVIKIEEGTNPPYITNKGQIFERVSSGSFPINESSKLAQLYKKREDQLTAIKNKIELPLIEIANKIPDNIYGYLDIGFSIVTSQPTSYQKNFFKLNITPIAEYLQKICEDFSISQVGYSYLFSIGNVMAKDNQGNLCQIGTGIHNFMEIMADGSIRCRVLLIGELNDNSVDITTIGYHFSIVFQKIYKMIIGKNFSKIFINANKFERLTVLKQFVPFYKLLKNDSDEDKKRFSQYLFDHKNKYGNNLMITSNRIPKNDYMIIDKKTFSNFKIKYNSENLLSELFSSAFLNLGFIDPPQ